MLKADRVYGAALRHSLERVWLSAGVRAVGSLAEARAALAERPVDLLLAGFGLPDGDVLPLLDGTVAERGWRRVLIVTGRKEERVLALLRAVPIAGVFDPEQEDLAWLLAVLPEVMAGRTYWSPSVLARFQRTTGGRDTLCRRLTRVELLVFSAVGDGSDNAVAGLRLGMKPSSVKSVRGVLHEKLGVQHKGELIRLAVESGVVRITAGGVHRPGFENLLAGHREKRRGSGGPFPVGTAGARPGGGAESSPPTTLICG